jgi:hypothetical protein
MVRSLPGARLRLARLTVATVLLAALLVSHVFGAHTLLPGAPARAATVDGVGAGHAPSLLAGAAGRPAPPAAIDPTLAPPSNLVLTTLDSTIRGNWTASSDPRTVRYAFSTWDGGTLIGAKIVPANSPAADANGLQTGHAYQIQVQSMDSAGNLSNPVAASATTEAQPPLPNVAFFDNFNGGVDGDLDPNYFDVRMHSTVGDTDGVFDSKLAFRSERHWHTQLVESQGQGGISVRPRVPVDFTGRTLTIEFEVDLPPVQSDIHDKWFEVQVSNTLPASSESYGTHGRDFPRSVTFGAYSSAEDGLPLNANKIQRPFIGINVNQPITTDPGESANDIPLFFQGPSSRYTPPNVRVPIVLKLSQTSAQLIINGVTAVTASGFSLPWSKGHVLFLHKNYRSGIIDAQPTTPKETLQLLHWDMIQYDGPPGSFNPVIRTYLQPGCRGTVYVYSQGFRSCPSFLDFAHPSPATVTVNVPENVAQAASARLLFNGAFTSPLTVSVNGQVLTTFPATGGNVEVTLNSYELTPAQRAFLVTGNNSFVFSGSGVLFPGLTQFELEVVYNQARVIGNPPLMPMPMLNFTDQNLRMDCLQNDPNPVKVATTLLYSLGSAPPVNYTLSLVYPTPQPNWLQILSPLTGSVTSPVVGGALVPVQLQVDCNLFPNIPDPQVGIPVILRADGGAMPVYVALLPVKAGFSSPPQFINGSLGGFGSNYNELVFNKAAIYTTPTATPVPRPNVGVQVTPAATAGQLTTTIAARIAGCPQGDNQLRSLRFTRLANATVDVNVAPVTTVSVTPTTVQLPALPASVQLTVRRTNSGQPVTVELTVTDGCGDWSTFVGGGPGAF